MSATSTTANVSGATPSGSPATITDLDLTSDTIASLKAAGIDDLAQLRSATELLELPGLADGRALYEIVCALNRRGLSLPADRDRRVPGDREREMLRLRVIDGLTLHQIGRHFGVSRERVRQLLNYDFRLKSTPPAVKARRADPADPTRRRRAPLPTPPSSNATSTVDFLTGQIV